MIDETHYVRLESTVTTGRACQFKRFTVTRCVLSLCLIATWDKTKSTWNSMHRMTLCPDRQTTCHTHTHTNTHCSTYHGGVIYLVKIRSIWKRTKVVKNVPRGFILHIYVTLAKSLQGIRVCVSRFVFAVRSNSQTFQDVFFFLFGSFISESSADGLFTFRMKSVNIVWDLGSEQFCSVWKRTLT